MLAQLGLYTAATNFILCVNYRVPGLCVYYCSTYYKVVRVGGGGIVEDMCYERLRAEVNVGDGEVRERERSFLTITKKSELSTEKLGNGESDFGGQ
jgi:hypothetical protein